MATETQSHKEGERKNISEHRPVLTMLIPFQTSSDSAPRWQIRYD